MARTARAEILVLDIETIPDLERWQRPEPHVPAPAPAPAPAAPPDAASPAVEAGARPVDHRRDRDGFPPIWAHRIVVIGCMLLDHDYRLKRLGVIGGAGSGKARVAPALDVPGSEADAREHALLEELSQFVGRHRPLLVTYNGRSFDLPVIAMRSLCHAVPLAWYYRDRDIRARYSPEGHFDLCDWLADHGATRAGKLDQLARLIGLPGKVGVDGSQVEGLHASGELAAIEKYCLADVAQTALLFLRFRLLQGAISVAAYRERVAELVADPRITDVLEGIDHARLLGPAPPPDPDDAFVAT